MISIASFKINLFIAERFGTRRSQCVYLILVFKKRKRVKITFFFVLENTGRDWKTVCFSTGKYWKMAKTVLENTGTGTPPEGGHPEINTPQSIW